MHSRNRRSKREEFTYIENFCLLLILLILFLGLKIFEIDKR